MFSPSAKKSNAYEPILTSSRKNRNSIFVTIVDIGGAEKCDLRIEPSDTIKQVKIKLVSKLNQPPYSNHGESSLQVDQISLLQRDLIIEQDNDTIIRDAAIEQGDRIVLVRKHEEVTVHDAVSEAMVVEQCQN